MRGLIGRRSWFGRPSWIGGPSAGRVRAPLIGALVVGAALALLRVGPSADRAGEEPTMHPTSRRAPIESPSAVGAGGDAPQDRAAAPLPPALPRLDRADVYGRIADSTLEDARVLVAGLRRALGTNGVPIVIEDFHRAVEADDLAQLAGSGFTLAEAARGPEPDLDDRDILDALDLLAVSDAAAAAVADILHHAGRIEGAHLERVVALWRAGLGSELRERCARSLFILHATQHRDPAPFLDLLDDPRPALAAAAAAALARIDPDRHRDAILARAERSAPGERARLISTVAAALDPHDAAELLGALSARWPDTRIVEPWIDVGARDGTALIDAYRVEPDPRVRRNLLVGWHPDGLDPASAERFLTEVLDTDDDPAVRAQALLAIGQVDDDRARERLAEATRQEGDATYDMHLAGGLQNALAHAPTDWIERVALPYARRRIAEASRPEYERTQWIEALRGRHPAARREIESW